MYKKCISYMWTEILTWLWYSMPMLKVLIKIATKIPCWKYLCSTSFLIDCLIQRTTLTQRYPQDLRNLFARDDFAHLSPSSGHWSVPPCISQQQEQLSMSVANHCVRSSKVICRSLMPKINTPIYIYPRRRISHPSVISSYIRCI